METQKFIEKIEILPESLQSQLNDYIDFLILKYIRIIDKEKKEDDFQLTHKLKKILDESLVHHENNQTKAKSGTEVLNSIAKKYGYEI